MVERRTTTGEPRKSTLVHVLNERARRFWLACGFRESRIESPILLARLADIETVLGAD